MAKIRFENDAGEGYGSRRIANFQRALLANCENRGQIYYERGFNTPQTYYQSSQVPHNHQEKTVR